MDIRKLIFFFCLLSCHHESETANSAESLTSSENRAINMCKDILGTKWKDDINKRLHPLCPNLTIWMNTAAFTEFVDVDKNGKPKGGFSIAVFCLVLQELPFKFQLIDFKPSISDCYNEIVKKLKDKSCQVVGGDIAIVANRTEYVDFTIAYMSSEIYMLVPAVRKWNQTLMTLLKPFTTRLWLSIISACIFIGVVVASLEYRQENPNFYNVPFYQKLLMIIWFPISTFYFREGVIRSRCSKVVLVIWLIMIFIVMQIYTACLSSWLTINQLQPKVPRQYHVVGYQNGSFVKDFVYDHVQSLYRVDYKVLPLSSLDDYKNTLDNGTVDAIFDQRPYIDVFIEKYGDNYTKVGPLATDNGLGFAISQKPPNLQPEFSRAVLKVTESPYMADMKKKYLGIQPSLPTQQSEYSPESFDVHSFFILFISMGLATIIAVICSEISLMCTRAQITPEISRSMMSVVQNVSSNSKQINNNEHQPSTLF